VPVAPAPAGDRSLATDGAEAGVVLVGSPNVGKSALFGALTGNYVTVSNYPGTTVEITTGTMSLGGTKISIRDTPGANSFIPSSEDERVTREILLTERPYAVLAVGDAKNLDRALFLVLQLSEMAVPMVLCLNMMDEADARGIGADRERLAEILGIEVVGTVAIRREGIGDLLGALREARVGRGTVAYPEAVERAAEALAALMPDAPISRRALALMVLAGDETLVDWLRVRVDPEALHAVEEIRQRTRRAYREPLGYVINEARLGAARAIASKVRRGPIERPRGTSALAARLDRLTTHPVWGFPLLLGVLYLAYLFVGRLGAGTLVGLLENGLFGRWINPWAIALAEWAVPWRFARDLLVGPYGIVTMALTYALALVLPIVGTFFLTFGLLEDSGYLPRLAVMANRIFKRMGLNGKAVLPMILGLGCDTMATLTTRILETRKERLIVILLLALGVPCSAQLTVVLAMLGSLSLAATLIWLAVVIGVIFLVGMLAARVLPGRGSDFVLELPPLRIPQARNVLVKTLARIEWYLKEAVPLFVAGTLILFALDRLRLLGAVERAAAPVLSGLLGLPRETAPAFVVGFLRRDFGAAGLYHMAAQGRLSPEQVLVAVVTITLFIPCIANFFVMVKERGLKTGIAIASFIFPFALAVGTALHWLLRAFPIPLR
jgi:ferrous iron transport protein B